MTTDGYARPVADFEASPQPSLIWVIAKERDLPDRQAILSLLLFLHTAKTTMIWQGVREFLCYTCQASEGHRHCTPEASVTPDTEA